MSQDKVKRRRFLADLLFAGGALTGAALLAQARAGEATATPTPASPTPLCSSTPVVVTPPEPSSPGLVAIPRTPEEPNPAGGFLPPIDQRVQLKGDVAPPRRP